MIRPRDALAGFIAECFKRSRPDEKAAAKRLRREALAIICEVKNTHTTEQFERFMRASWQVQELGRALPVEHREAVLCDVVRELLVDADGILCDLDDAIRKACFRHPMHPEAAHHVGAIVRECLRMVEGDARTTEAA